MTPAQHAPGQHLSTCSDPTNCAEYGSLLTMSAAEHCAWIQQDRARLRTASAGTRQFRVSQQEDFTPPDPYTLAIARRRKVEETPESRFAERYKAERLRELEEEYAAAARRTPQQPAPRLTAAEVAAFAPPNGYQIALDKMRSESR